MNTSTNPKDPWQVAEALGVQVLIANLPGLAGLNTEKAIYLAPETSRNMRSTLAHELGHRVRGEVHIPHQFSHRSELAADLYAAELLIDPAQLATLASAYPDNPGQIAYELDVADWVLNTYLRAHPEALTSYEDAA